MTPLAHSEKSRRSNTCALDAALRSRLSNRVASLLIPTGCATIDCNTSPSSIEQSMNCLAHMLGSRALASAQCCAPTAGLRQPSLVRIQIATGLINVDNYGDCWTSGEHRRTSPDLARNPMAPCRSGQDDCRAQGWRITLGTARIGPLRRIRAGAEGAALEQIPVMLQHIPREQRSWRRFRRATAARTVRCGGEVLPRYARRTCAGMP